MKKEVLAISIVTLLLLVPFSQAQLNSIEIKDVNVNESQLQVLVQNNINQDFFKETFIINSQYTIIQDEELNALESKFFIVNYPGGIKLETVKVIVGDQSTDYVFIGNEDKFVLQQEITSQAFTVESNSPISYIYSNQRLAKIQDNQIVYFSSDNVGSTSLQTDVNSNIKFKANYLPFGKELSFSSIEKEKIGFSGKYFDDESSLNYFNARYYNPSSGKFISNDPIFKPTEGGYQYVSNNPLTITDPSGKNSCPGCNPLYGIGKFAEARLASSNVDKYLSSIDPHPELFLAANKPPGLNLFGAVDLASGLFGVAGGGALSNRELYRGEAIRRNYARVRSQRLTGKEIIAATRELIAQYGSLKSAFSEGELIGGGVFGTVHRQGDITLKHLGFGTSVFPLDRNDARAEARIVTRSSDYGITMGSAFLFGRFIVKEFVPGVNLKQGLIKKESALSFINRLGRYDRENPNLLFWDIKGENVIGSHGGKLFLVDPYPYKEAMMESFDVVRYKDLVDFYRDAKWEGPAPTFAEVSNAYYNGLQGR